MKTIIVMARHLLSRTLPVGLLGAVALGAAPPSVAATLHVAAGAPGDGDGTAGRPFAHLAPAMAAASAGDTVRLAPGIYSETVVTQAYGNPRLALLVLKEDVVVAGAGPGATILRALPADTLTFGITAAGVGPGAVVRDLSVTGACFHGVNTRAGSPTLVNLEIRTDLVGASSTAADFRDGSDPAVEGCVFDGGHSALFVEFGSRGTFTGCVIAGRPNDGVSITRADPVFLDCTFESAGRDVVVLNGGSLPVFDGCTIADGGRWSVRVTGYAPGSEVDLAGNRWFSNDPAVIRTRILDAADDPALGATVVVEPMADGVSVERRSFGSFKSLYR